MAKRRVCGCPPNPCIKYDGDKADLGERGTPKQKALYEYCKSTLQQTCKCEDLQKALQRKRLTTSDA